MKRAISLTALCVVLASCAPIELRAVIPQGDADAAYRVGRAHHLALKPDAARAAYLIALQIAPSHIDARNGLATLHVEAREYQAAIAIWTELTAAINMASGPSAAYLFSNLGRAHILAGESGAATAALEKACLLDPLNDRTWQLLGETLRRQGMDARADQMLGQAAALRQHDLRADIAATGGATRAAALDNALAPQALPRHPGWAQATLHVGVDGMMELRRTPAQAVSNDEPRGVAVAQLEIRNGNGVAGMARAMARQLGESGVTVTRLSNEPGFAVRQTRIEYTANHRDGARQLARRLGSAELRQVEKCAPADLRLVLGRDLASLRAPLRKAG